MSEQPEPAPIDRDAMTSRLVHDARAGDTASFAALYQKIAPAIFAWSNLRLPRHLRAWIEPEEIVQEVWVRALDRFHTYDPDRAPFRVWVFRIAGNTLLELMRKVSRQLRVQPAEGGTNSARLLPMEHVPDDVTTVSRRISRSEGLRAFMDAVDQLEEDDKRLLLYRGLEGLPHVQVAERLGISVEAVHKRWQRLRNRFENSTLPQTLLAED